MMLFGLPVETWLLLGVATVPGLVLVVRAHRVHGRRRPPRSRGHGGGGDTPVESGPGSEGFEQDERMHGPDRV